MKPFLLSASAIVLLLSVQQFAENKNLRQAFATAAQSQKKSLPRVDTFRAIRKLFQGKTGKAVAEDTIILIMHEYDPFPPVPKKAGWKYLLEPVAYNPFDTVISAKAKEDTLVWTSKPYRP